MAILNEDYIKGKVRNRLQLAVSDLDDAAVESAIEDATRDFGRYKKLDVWGTITLQSEKQDYVVASDFVIAPALGDFAATDIQRVTAVLYSPGTLLYDAISFDAELQKVVDADLLRTQFGGNVFDNPSLVHIFFQKLTHYRNNFDVQFIELNSPVGKIVRLSRVPVSTAPAYFEADGKWSIDNIEDEESEIYLKAVLGHCCESRANKIAVANSYSEASGVSISPAFKYWSDKSDLYMKEFREYFGGSAGIFMKG